MKINKLLKVGEKVVTSTILVDDVDENGNVIGQHEETVSQTVDKMEARTVDMTPEEEAEALKAQAEAEEYERTRPRTAEEQIEELKAENEMLLECVLEMSEIVYA